MTYDTINDAMTIAGNGEGTLLAGRYRVVRQLGQGGMGNVWLAEDTQLDNKPFAIKMLPAVLVSNKRAYRQLKDEALVAMKLTHPNIVTLRAFEENNGNPFLVMDYIDGQTLDDYLAEHGEYFTQRRREAEAQSGRARSPSAPQGGGFGRVEHVERVDGDGRGITGDEVVRILKPIAAALDYAHAEGVVHRDVKPANVMIRKDGHPFILDFGIAREIQETLTRVTGKLSSGTLLYMSPEQLNGDQPKPAQDVYSFAAMVYECLKGEPPFVRGQIEHQILNNPPPPLNLPTAGPSARGSGTLAASVMAGLAKKPENRPASCMAVLEGKDFSRVEHVERVESGGNGRARSPSAPQSGGPRPVAAVKAAATLKTAALAVAALVLVIAGGIIWYSYRQRQQDEARRQARIVAEQKAEEERLAAERNAQEEAARRRADEERKAKEEAERRRKAAEEALLAAERKAKDAATEIRIEAKVQQGKVARISEGDGFKARKDALEDVFIRAEAFYDEKARRWAEAGALYKDYIEQSKSVITLDGERQQAVSKRSAAQAAFRNAEAEGAKTYAKDSWNGAVKTWNEAAAEFRRMEFASAAVTFAKAVREFEGSMDEVREKKRAEEEKLAEEKRMAEAREAERRRQEEIARQAEARERERRRAEAKRALAERERQRAAADNGHKKVQLWAGGPYWATTNIGANRPEEYGLYFQWGDTTGHPLSRGFFRDFDFDFSPNNSYTYGKSKSALQSAGWLTGGGVLSPSHDAAHVHWGGAWRMPTKQELDDLRSKCDWRGTSMNCVGGYVVCGRGAYASNSIFLPCAGVVKGTRRYGADYINGFYGYYWSSIPNSGDDGAWNIFFDGFRNFSSNGLNMLCSVRYFGMPIRPVQGFTK